MSVVRGRKVGVKASGFLSQTQSLLKGLLPQSHCREQEVPELSASWPTACEVFLVGLEMNLQPLLPFTRHIPQRDFLDRKSVV